MGRHDLATRVWRFGKARKASLGRARYALVIPHMYFTSFTVKHASR